MRSKRVGRTLGAIVIAGPLALGACKKKEAVPSSSDGAPRHPSASPPLVPSGTLTASASAPSGTPTGSASAAISNDPLLAAPSQPKFKVEPIPKIPLEIWVYTLGREGRNTASGQSARARPAGIPAWTPFLRTS